ncbi:MerR family transcriptional regulator [Parasedimentitalea denitrificans]|uniref:MerR family transcriptional regulator n=1 Tax=Parasedimentitalea denitrificans TaxID=2211118 RepID=UPI001F0F1829|nr:MerR family transcriptional regulator [Sedimentitalea sp. CY04]
MSKSPDAFRTISEVAEWLGIPAHVLRFWESKFTQIKPVKRAGGRRYYRPADMLLLGGIKRLLHDEGKSIKEVQALLRDQGIAHVADQSASLEDTSDPMPVIEAAGTVTEFPAPPPHATSQMQMDLDSQPNSDADQTQDIPDFQLEPAIEVADVPVSQPEVAAQLPDVPELQPEPAVELSEPTGELPTDVGFPPEPEEQQLGFDTLDPAPVETPEPTVDAPEIAAQVEASPVTETEVAVPRPNVIEVDDTADDALNISHTGILAKLAGITSLPESNLAEVLICAEQLRSMATNQNNPSAN